MSFSSWLFGSDPKQTTDSTTTVTHPGWINTPEQQITNAAMKAFNTPYNPYSGQQVADFSPFQNQFFQGIQGLQGQTNPGFQQAQGITNQVANTALNGPSQQQLSGYMNPYISNVLDAQHQRDLQAYSQQENALKQQQAAIGAFGGSRSALAQQQLLKNFNQNEQYNQSTGMANAFTQGLQGAMQGNQLAGQAAMNLGNLTQGQQSSNLAQLNALGQAGSQQQQLNQQQLNVPYNQYLTQLAYPYQQAQFAAGILNPQAQLYSTQNSNSTQTQSGGSGFLGTALGLGATALGAYMGMPGVGAGLGSMGANIFGGGSMSNAISGVFGNSNSMTPTLSNAIQSSTPSNPYGTLSAIMNAPYAKGGVVGHHNYGPMSNSPGYAGGGQLQMNTPQNGMNAGGNPGNMTPPNYQAQNSGMGGPLSIPSATQPSSIFNGSQQGLIDASKPIHDNPGHMNLGNASPEQIAALQQQSIANEMKSYGTTDPTAISRMAAARNPAATGTFTQPTQGSFNNNMFPTTATGNNGNPSTSVWDGSPSTISAMAQNPSLMQLAMTPGLNFQMAPGNNTPTPNGSAGSAAAYVNSIQNQGGMAAATNNDRMGWEAAAAKSMNNPFNPTNLILDAAGAGIGAGFGGMGFLPGLAEGVGSGLASGGLQGGLLGGGKSVAGSLGQDAFGFAMGGPVGKSTNDYAAKLDWLSTKREYLRSPSFGTNPGKLPGGVYKAQKTAKFADGGGIDMNPQSQSDLTNLIDNTQSTPTPGLQPAVQAIQNGSPFQGQEQAPQQMSGPVNPAIMQTVASAENKYNLPPGLLAAQMMAESKGNPNAVSQAGAQGIMQIMPTNFKKLGITNPFNPTQSINGAAKLMRQHLNSYNGNVPKALAAYNWGPTNLKKYGMSKMPGETQNYIGKVMSYLPGQPGPRGKGYAEGGVIKGYADGGYADQTPFMNDLSGAVGPLMQGGSNFQNDLSGSMLADTQGINRMGQYFTAPQSQYNQNQTPFDPMARVMQTAALQSALGFAGSNLEHGQMPPNMQHMIDQTTALAANPKTGEVSLGSDGQLQVTPKAQSATPFRPEDLWSQAQGDTPSEKTNNLVSNMLGGTTPDKTTSAEKSDYNYPLLAFGAAMLGSHQNFFHSLGAGVQAFTETKMSQNQMQLAMAKLQAQNQLRGIQLLNEAQKNEYYGQMAKARLIAAQRPMAQTQEQAKLQMNWDNNLIKWQGQGGKTEDYIKQFGARPSVIVPQNTNLNNVNQLPWEMPPQSEGDITSGME